MMTGRRRRREIDRLMPARLTQIHRSLIEAKTPDGAVILTTENSSSTGDFAVGDWVLVDGQARLERMTVLERRVAGGAEREIFRSEIDVDEATWARGRGWALYAALVALPYYLHTNERIVDMAWRILREVLPRPDGV